MRDEAFGENLIAHGVRSYGGCGRFPAARSSTRLHARYMVNTPGHHALRKGRVSRPGQIYLLTTVTAERTPWFSHLALARIVCRSLIEPGTWGDARPLCWVCMPDHWHGLVELGACDSLALVANRLKSITCKRLHAARPGARIWARGYHDHALRRDEDLHAAARYIIANPLRAGLATRVGDYPYWDCIWL